MTNNGDIVEYTSLIQNFDWLLLPIGLVPLAMAMLNHRLFGVRGIIRRRVRFPERIVAREKGLVTTRDQRIHTFVDEIRQLKTELQQYSGLERLGSTHNPRNRS